MDWVKALWAGASLVAIGLLFLGFVAWSNPGSRNIGLATGAVVAAFALLVLQLLYEFRSPAPTVDAVSVDYTIDRAIPSVSQWDYPAGTFQREIVEAIASKWLLTTKPEAYTSDRYRLTIDFAMLSLVRCLADQHRYQDWQMAPLVFRGSAAAFTTIRPPHFLNLEESRPRKLTIVTESDLSSQLASVGNGFAKAPFPSHLDKNFYFPPSTKIKITDRSPQVVGGNIIRQSLFLENPFCRVEFSLIPDEGVSHVKPRPRGTPADARFEVPKLPNGEEQLETRVTLLRIETRYPGIRTQDSDAESYRTWAKRVIDGVRAWFEGPIYPAYLSKKPLNENPPASKP